MQDLLDYDKKLKARLDKALRNALKKKEEYMKKKIKQREEKEEIDVDKSTSPVIHTKQPVVSRDRKEGEDLLRRQRSIGDGRNKDLRVRRTDYPLYE